MGSISKYEASCAGDGSAETSSGKMSVVSVRPVGACEPTVAADFGRARRFRLSGRYSFQ
jgi:hypothetical protein